MSHIRIKYPTQVVKQKCLSEDPERHFFLILLLNRDSAGIGPSAFPYLRGASYKLLKNNPPLWQDCFLYPDVPYVSKLSTSLPGIKKAQQSCAFLKFVIRLAHVTRFECQRVTSRFSKTVTAYGYTFVFRMSLVSRQRLPEFFHCFQSVVFMSSFRLFSTLCRLS